MTTSRSVWADDCQTSVRALQAGLLAAVGSAIAVVALAEIAKGSGVAHVHQLRAAALIFTTVVGVSVGTVGWVLVSAHASRPRQVLRILVPAVLALSFIPDVLTAVGGTTWGATVTLAIAHVVVFAVTIPIFLRRLAPETISPRVTAVQ